MRWTISGALKVLVSGSAVCDRQSTSGVLLARGWKNICLAPQVRNFEARPLPPQVHARGCLHQVGDKRSTDAGGDLEKIDLPIAVCFDVLGVGHSASQAKRGRQGRVECGEFLPVAAGAIDGPGGEDAAFVHHLHGRPAILMHRRKDHLALADDRIHVEDLAGNEPLHHKMALPVAQLVKGAPQLLGFVNLSDPEG
jgi:hypothetical protein